VSHLGLESGSRCREFRWRDLIGLPGRPVDDGRDAAAIGEEALFLLGLKAPVGRS
jgi:hypothetical protein